MYRKFEGPNWSTYMQWPNVIEAIANCTVSDDSVSRWGGRDEMCWNQLDCALTAADASQQAQYSSAATILGLLPTVLSMMATSTEDLLRIHHRYPVLAFLLSLCNPSTILSGLSSPWHPNRVIDARRLLNTKRSPAYQKMKSALSINLPYSDTTIGMTDFLHDLLLHIFTAGVSTMMIWQALLLGMRGVIVFACWTWHEPFTWVGVGGLIHLLSTITWRLCLGPVLNHPNPKNISRWHWSLSHSQGCLTLKYPKIARFMSLVFQVLGLMNYGYGTVMLSGTSLVSPRNSLTVFCLMGYAGVCSRFVGIWLLEVYPEVYVEEGGEDDGLRLLGMGLGAGKGGEESTVTLLDERRIDERVGI